MARPAHRCGSASQALVTYFKSGFATASDDFSHLDGCVFMMIAPESRYWAVTGVPDRGPFNQHFVRDIGFIYLLGRAAFVFGSVYTRHRLQLWLVPTAWLAFHAVFHVWEVVVGICGPESLVEDLAGVTVPALLGLGLIYASYTVQGCE
ncbi:MAG: hypothetical protein NXH95_09730 [Pseudomonadaceae bacterium]|nr:hypothetical protein [Pseudomonadaceae bacterium]